MTSSSTTNVRKLPWAMLSYNTLGVFSLSFLALLLLQDVSNAYTTDGNNATIAQEWRSSSIDSSLASSQSLSQYQHHRQPISFYVMGDTPYKPKESILLINQLKEVYQDKHLSFIFHVGDLMRKSDCREWRYQHASNVLFGKGRTTPPLLSQNVTNTTSYSTGSSGGGVPVLVLPGDNDWLECPNRTFAFGQFKRHLIVENPTMQYIDESHHFSRQAKRVENFVLWKDDILFFGLNMLGRRDGLWKRRYELNIQWFLFQFNKYYNATTSSTATPTSTAPEQQPQQQNIRLIVIVAHSAAARPVYHFIRKFTVHKNIPVLFLHGNGHVYTITQERENFVKIQLDRGGFAPPLKVQVYGDECTNASARASNSSSSSNTTNATATIVSLFSGLVCIDRRLMETSTRTKNEG